MKPTPAQLALLHVAESAGSSALLTLLVGVIQGLALHQINPGELATIFGSGLVAAFGLIYKTVKSSSSLGQAESDTVAEIKQFIGDRFASLEAHLPFLAMDAPTAKVSAVTAKPPAPTSTT